MAVSLSSSSCASCIGHLKAVPSPSAASILARHGSLHGLAESRGLVAKSCAVSPREVTMPRTSLLVSSLRGKPVLRNMDKHKAGNMTVTGKRCGADVWASIEQWAVKEVALVSKEPLFYNVTLIVSPESEVATSYTTPGQYLDLIRAETQFSNASAFFIASPAHPEKAYKELDFLIEDVPNTVANEIINSKPGDRVAVTTSPYSTGFNLSALNPIEESSSVLMFASGYGLSPFRALIETGFQANKRKDAILYALYTRDQAPYVNRFLEWEKTGVKVLQGPLVKNGIIETDPAKTIVLMVATTDQQEKLAAYFEKKGVPEDRILTLFGGIPTSDKSYYTKVLHQLNYYPKFPHHAKKHVPVELTV